MTTSREEFEAWYWRFYISAPKTRQRLIGTFRKYSEDAGRMSGEYILYDVQRSFDAYQAATARARKIAQEMNQPAVAGAIGGEESIKP